MVEKSLSTGPTTVLDKKQGCLSLPETDFQKQLLMNVALQG